MKKTVGTFIVLFATVLVIGGAWAQPLPTAKPEQVGMSSERLARLGPALKAQIANERFPGAVVLVARKGKVVYFETVGQRDRTALRSLGPRSTVWSRDGRGCDCSVISFRQGRPSTGAGPRSSGRCEASSR